MGFSAQEDAEYEDCNDETSELSIAVTQLAASFATTHPCDTAHQPDPALSDSLNRILVYGASCARLTPLLASQNLKVASEVRSISSEPKSPESASIVVDGNDHSPASLSFGLEQDLYHRLLRWIADLLGLSSPGNRPW